MLNVPAIPYMLLVKQFAMARRLPFFTWEEMKLAAMLYDEKAKMNN